MAAAFFGPSFRHGVFAFSEFLASISGLEAGIGERQAVLAFALCRSKAKLSAHTGATHTVQEDPLASTMRTGLDREVKPSAVSVAPGLRNGLRLTRGKLVQLSFGHLRPTIRPTIEHGSL